MTKVVRQCDEDHPARGQHLAELSQGGCDLGLGLEMRQGVVEGDDGVEGPWDGFRDGAHVGWGRID